MSPAWKLAVAVVVSLGSFAAFSPPSFADQPPPVADATVITGPPVAFRPGVVTADLQHGLVLGTTTYRHSDGFVYTEVHVPYLWSDNGSSPTSVLMEPPGDLATEPSIYIPNGVTPNGSAVVGGVIFPEQLFTQPWAWTPTTGLQFLQLPSDTRYGGAAVGVSESGNVIAGTLAGRFVPSKAAIWQDGALKTLATSQTWSQVNAISGDGSVVVGASGPSSTTLQATSWVNGSEQPLSTGDLAPQSSTALFIADNRTIFGTATLASGQAVLLRWDANGNLAVLTPPNGLSVVQFSSIDSVGSAVGGALAPQTHCISFLDPACDQEPFVWTAQDGFHILPETPVLTQNRHTFGDKSTVTGVADGGRVAVGTLTPAESINGFPPQTAFVWSAQSGLVLVNDLMSGFGQPNADYFAGGNISPDGTQVLVSGNPPNDAAPYDTATARLDLTPLWTGQGGGVTGIQSNGATTAASQATGPAQPPQSSDDSLKQQLTSLPTDVHAQLQTWPGAASILGAGQAQPATSSPTQTQPAASSPTAPAAQACPQPAPGYMQCFALARQGAVQDPGTAPGQSLPVGYGPADLQAAYNLPSGMGSGQLVAIVDAGDDPNAEADLAVYRHTYGLPPCTSADGCFEKVNQRGQQGPYPPKILTGNWPLEESLDIDMVSAACPNCRIVLVEADDNSIANLAAATDEAASFRPVAISNSYGTSEFDGMDTFASSYDHPGIAITASSDDSGFGPAQFPAVLSTVTAVGGTSLLHQGQGTRGWTESAWNGAGSGCSALVPKPAWQTDKLCSMRATADVSAVADPNTGLAVYDSTPLFGLSGWLVAGGTSASAPLIAGVIGLAGNGGIPPSYPYAQTHSHALYDITAGSNGFCGDAYICTAKRGYDGPTGLGVPNGTGAF